MVLHNLKNQFQKAGFGFAVLCSTLSFVRIVDAQLVDENAGKITERIIQVHTKDDVADAGVLLTPTTNAPRPIAVIWIHGAAQNFYSPTYLAISRSLAKKGYTVISGNTRMHDLGNVEAWHGEKRIRGGTYWGVPSEQVRDIAAWIDLAGKLGLKQVLLAGHSAGANAVREYQAQTQDTRVAGVVLASGDVRPDTRVPPPEWVSRAKEDIAEGRPEDLVQGPFLSAATFLDLLNRPPEFTDFFGELSSNAGVTRVRCPLLIILGTNGDVGNEEDLEKIKTSINRLPTRPSRVDTALIQGGDHMYDGQEDRVAQVIANWEDTLMSANVEKSGTHRHP